MNAPETEDDWEIFRALRSAKKELRAEYGRPCTVCTERLPKAPPSMLLPGQKCKIHGYKDMRPRLSEDEVNAVFSKFGLKKEKYDVKRHGR